MMKLLAVLMTIGLAIATQAAFAQNVDNTIPAGWVAVGNAGSFVSSQNGLNTDGRLEYVSTANSAATGIGYGLGTETNGSTLTTNTFSATTGSSLSMSLAFLTSDGLGFDYGFANLIDATSGKTVAVLYDINSADLGFGIGFEAPGTGLPAMASMGLGGYAPGAGANAGAFYLPVLGQSSLTCEGSGCGFTSLESYTYQFTKAGSYKLQFGVTNTDDTKFDSALGIDLNALTLNGTPLVSSVPEPSTYLMLLAGMVGLALFTRRAAVA